MAEIIHECCGRPESECRCDIDLLRAYMKAQVAELCCVMRMEGHIKRFTPESDADEILKLIASLGGALVVEGELPKQPYPTDYDKLPDEFQEDDTYVTSDDVYLMAGNGFEKGKSKMLKWHRDSIVPLVEE